MYRVKDRPTVSCILSSFHVASTVSASSATATPQSPPPTGEMLCLTQIV